MPGSPDKMEIGRYLSERLLPLAAGIALLITLLAPLTYWSIAHSDNQRRAEFYAEDLAQRFAELALEAPELWQYQTYKFITMGELSRLKPDLEGFCVFDAAGRPVNGYQYGKGRRRLEQLSYWEEFFHSQGRASIVFNDRRMGTVQVLVSDARFLRVAVVLFAVSLLAGTCLALVVYRFPVRVVRKMELEIR